MPRYSTGLWDHLVEADTVVVPGLDEPDRRREPEALGALTAAARRGARMVGLCAGAFPLGCAGILDGRRVTTHWALAEPFRTLFPRAILLDDELFVDDGDVLTSGGMLAAADLCLHVLRTDHGQHYANDVARLLVSPPFRVGGQAQYRVDGQDAGSHGSLGALTAWIDDHLHEALTVPALASRAGMRTRTLSRHFDAVTGRTAAVDQRAPDRAARVLLEETDLTVTDVAFGTGFGSLAAFRRQFVRTTGTTPRNYRLTFREPGARPAATRDS